MATYLEVSVEILEFKDILVIIALSIFLLLLGHQLRFPPIVSFLLTGVIAGPHGLSLVVKTGDVEILAELGIILLLFGIGMEFSIKKLVQIKRQFLLGGSLQVGLTVISGIIIGKVFGRSLGESFLLGCLLAMSSTAIALRLLEQKGESSSPHGRVSIATLIFQDMVAIPLILIIPLLGSKEGVDFDWAIVWLLIKGVFVLVVVFFSAERVVPKLLLMVARTKNKDLFLLTVLGLCFGVAGLASALGLSLTIGAFLAGLIVSESEYSNDAIGHIFPFQSLFICFFFVSVGMLLDMNFVFQQPILILVLALCVIALKIVAGGTASVFLGLPLRSAIMAGIILSQIGEFSFVLAKTGLSAGLGSEYLYQLFLAVSLLTMALNPLLIGFGTQITDWLITALPLSEKIKTGVQHTSVKENALENHVIIVGFGVSGRNLARSCKLAGIAYVILEMNPDTVREQKRLGEPIHFGDATHPSVLEHMNIHQAKAVAVLINDPVASHRIVKSAREINQHLYIIVRTRYVQEMALMIKLGADEVIPDEFGTSLEIFARVLRQYHIPGEDIDRFIADIRADGYELLRNNQKIPTSLSEIKMNLSNVQVSSFRLNGSSPLVGKSLSESDLRKAHGLTVLLIKRDAKVFPNPAPDTCFAANDVIIVVGEKVSHAAALFGAPA